MTETGAAAQSLKDRHVMVLFNDDGSVDEFALTAVIHPSQTVDFLARFPVDSGEWRALPAMDMTDIDFIKDRGKA